MKVRSQIIVLYTGLSITISEIESFQIKWLNRWVESTFGKLKSTRQVEKKLMDKGKNQSKLI
jgi:hypothetical protein